MRATKVVNTENENMLRHQWPPIGALVRKKRRIAVMFGAIRRVR